MSRAASSAGDHQAELEVFTVVERVIERGDSVAPAHRPGIGMDRDGVGVEDRSEPAALGEDVAQVGGEPVGDVDQGVEGRGLVQAPEPRRSAARAAGAGRIQAAAQRAGNQDRVAGPGTRAADRTARGRFAEQRSC